MPEVEVKLTLNTASLQRNAEEAAGIVGGITGGAGAGAGAGKPPKEPITQTSRAFGAVTQNLGGMANPFITDEERAAQYAPQAVGAVAEQAAMFANPLMTERMGRLIGEGAAVAIKERLREGAMIEGGVGQSLAQRFGQMASMMQGDPSKSEAFRASIRRAATAIRPYHQRQVQGMKTVYQELNSMEKERQAEVVVLGSAATAVQNPTLGLAKMAWDAFWGTGSGGRVERGE